MQSEIETDVNVSADGQSVSSTVNVRGTLVYCSVTRQALEQWFWLPKPASDEKLLKTFFDGINRISAVATRKALSLGAVAGPIVLEAKEFRVNA